MSDGSEQAPQAPAVVTDENERLREAIAMVLDREMPTGNASCATEIEKIKLLLRAALEHVVAPRSDSS